MFIQIIVRKFEHKLHDLRLLLFSFAHLAREQQNSVYDYFVYWRLSRSSKSRNFVLWNYLVPLTASQLWFFFESNSRSFHSSSFPTSLRTAMWCSICSTSVFRKILSISCARACPQLLSLPLFLSLTFFWLEFDVEQMLAICIYI